MAKKMIALVLVTSLVVASAQCVLAVDTGPTVNVWVSKVNDSDSGMEKPWSNRGRCNSKQMMGRTSATILW